jgi:hypothetical protein
MKKKFLINTISLIFLFAFCVSFVWPKISETLEIRKEQGALNQKMADLDKKTGKIEFLGQELEKNIEDQEIVSKYIPPARGDEFLINYLDSVALAEGISPGNIGIKKKESDVITQEESGALTITASPKPVFETAKFNFFASYEKIVTLLKKFDGLERFNEVSYLKITKVYPENNKEDANLNFLQVELSLDFNHLKKITSQAEIDENLFNKDGFDQEVLAKIKNKAINGANNPDGRTDGRKNIFVP